MRTDTDRNIWNGGYPEARKAALDDAAHQIELGDGSA
jgi:hypothetical protein